MKIRKIIHNIDFIHILTFNQYYRSIVSPYFDYANLEYGIDNENTLNETIRLIFKKEGFGLQFKKEGTVLVYEGDISEAKKSNAIIDIYFDIFEKFKKMDGFNRTTRHKMAIYFVETETEENVSEFLLKNEYLRNPFGKLKDFMTVLEFDKDGYQAKVQFGNFNKNDLIKQNLAQMQTGYNEDLIDKVGRMAIINVIEETNSPSFSKFKKLISEGEEILDKYLTV